MKILKKYCIEIYGECYHHCTTIASKEIECADRIVSETRIYKAVVVSARAKECLSI